MRTVVLLTCYNRPRLVQDAISSVLEQSDHSVRLMVLDDGCDDETRAAIERALARPMLEAFLPADIGAVLHGADGGVFLDAATPRVIWWKGAQRPMSNRKATIPYSRSINFALNHLLADEKYVTYLCDDDTLYTESIQVRADYLDANPDAHVVYGLSRSVQFDAGGFNQWTGNVAPKPGRHYPRPTGRRVYRDNGGPLHYFADPNERDPETGLPYVEEAFWQETPLTYGLEGKPDHNQVMHRRECLTSCYPWPDGAELGGKEFWGEDLRWGVGDAAFFTLLGRAHKFHSVDAWVCSKKFHSLSDGVSRAEKRE